MTIFELIKILSKSSFDGQEQVMASVKTVINGKCKEVAGFVESFSIEYPNGDRNEIPVIVLEAEDI